MSQGLTKKQRKKRNRIVVALTIFFALIVLDDVVNIFDQLPYGLWFEFAAFLVP